MEYKVFVSYTNWPDGRRARFNSMWLLTRGVGD